MNCASIRRHLVRLTWLASIVLASGCPSSGIDGTTDPAPEGSDSQDAGLDIPFVAGMRWLYDLNRKNTVVSASTGVHVSEFIGERLLHADEELPWAGRTAWRLSQFDLRENPGNNVGFEVETMYVSEGADGLEKWVDNSSGGEWRRILSTQSQVFDNAVFLMAGGPTEGDDTMLSSPVSITVPAGTFVTTQTHHQYSATGSFATEDVFEDRWEYYAEGVGLVRASWDYSFDDNDPSASDLYSVGTVELRGTNAGPTVVSEVEPNDVGTAVASQTVTIDGIIAGFAHISDASTTVDDANVDPDENGLPSLQDWYRFSIGSARSIHIALAYDIYDLDRNEYSDLDLYLFREESDGTLVFVDRSVLNPRSDSGRDGEWITGDFAAGNYYLAVQAWSTPGEAVEYWIAVR